MNNLNLFFISVNIFFIVLYLKDRNTINKQEQKILELKNLQEGTPIIYENISEMKYKEICDLYRWHKEKLIFIDEALKKIDKSVGTSSSSSSTYTKPKQ